MICGRTVITVVSLIVIEPPYIRAGEETPPLEADGVELHAFLSDGTWKCACRSGTSLLKPNELIRVERTLFEKMKQLTEPALAKTMKGILTSAEIRPLLKRRDAIVALFDKQIAQRGENAVFFTLSPLAAK